MIAIHPQYIKDTAGRKLVILPQKEFDSMMEQLKQFEFKISEADDWADQLTEEQILLIEKGQEDIKEDKIVSHEEAKERIGNYIRKKSI